MKKTLTFLGTGTSAVVAKKLQRYFIGIDQNNEYIQIAKTRLKKTKSYEDDVVILKKSRKDLPKIPFGELVEQGLIPAGAVLTDATNKFKAKVNSDGSLIIENIIGSIHQVGAKIQGLPSCNGWDYWHLKNKNGTVLIDNIRNDYRSKKLI